MLDTFKLLLIALSAAPAAAQQPQYQTPAGTPVQGVAAYALPYAVGSFSSFRPSTTIVTVGNYENAVTCGVQLVWRDWNNALAGVSGPYPVAPGQTFEFTTTWFPNSSGISIPPFIENVFADGDLGFEGHAKVHVVGCPATARLRVNAQALFREQRDFEPGTQLIEYQHLKVTRVPGNNGD